jgi:NADPH:quinone reductase-like Zn-dependent oxidoreductase
MKAILYHTHGGPEVLEYTDHPDPRPAPGEVLVRVRAAALNRVDIWTRNGWSGIKLQYPHIPGSDGAGEIAALGEGIGDNVADWEVGQRVVINSNIGCGQCDFCLAGQDNLCRTWHLLGETIAGTNAEFVAVPATNLLALPDGFDFHAAAAASLVFLTAWHSLITRANLRPGESVLIVGASGGVNTASIQIAKLAGAAVYVVGAGKKKLALAESLGADFLIDRMKDEDWSKAIFKMTNRRGVDVIVDNVGTTYPLSFRAARKGGRILTVGNTGGPKFEIDNRYMFGKHLSLIGSTMGTKKDFTDVMGLIFAGKLRPVMDKTFPITEARAAHKRLEKGEQLGKITLAIE